MGIAEKIKSEGRARKVLSVAASSDHGTPAPTLPAPALPVPVKKAASPAPRPPKPTNPPKKKGTALIKKATRKKANPGGIKIPELP